MIWEGNCSHRQGPLRIWGWNCSPGGRKETVPHGHGPLWWRDEELTSKSRKHEAALLQPDPPACPLVGAVRGGRGEVILLTLCNTREGNVGVTSGQDLHPKATVSQFLVCGSFPTPGARPLQPGRDTARRAHSWPLSKKVRCMALKTRLIFGHYDHL